MRIAWDGLGHAGRAALHLLRSQEGEGNPWPLA